MRRPPRRDAGATLSILAFALSILLVSIGTLYLTEAQDNLRMAGDEIAQARAECVAEAALHRAVMAIVGHEGYAGTFSLEFTMRGEQGEQSDVGRASYRIRAARPGSESLFFVEVHVLEPDTGYVLSRIVELDRLAGRAYVRN